ncbi:MAG: response regulator [Planctomycetes bacterium]|nr:response regulator [Planctomycetota bacterium]
MLALIVDDSRTMRLVLKKILNEVGFEVSEAGDGSEALIRLKELDRVDLMLVDWNMPVMDGLEFVRAVRQDNAYDEVPLMMVTTEDTMDRVVEALNAGANEYVMKPFTSESIIEKLEILDLLTGQFEQ